jgi:ribosome-associated toxin RatA of RatAB toxin-antitoxin module
MHSVTARRTIQASPEQVWALATDIARWPDTISGVDRVEVLSEGDFGPGTRWRETRTMLGREATEEMWVTATDPERFYTVEAESHGAHYVSTFTFTETAPEQTEVVLKFSGRPQSTVARVLAKVTGPVASRSVAKALQKDLDDLAAAAERPERH